MIPLLITIKCSFLPRITTMIDGVAIVLRTIKELGGITSVIIPISMACTLEQVRLVARVSDGTIGILIV